MCSTVKTFMLSAMLGLAATSVVAAAEVRIKPQAQVRTSVVLVGDVADVFAADEFQREQLAKIELGPAPLAGQKRIVRAREIQDAVLMRGINVSLHQFSGAEQAEVGSAGELFVAAAPTTLNAAQRQRAERTVADLIVAELQAAAGNRDPYQVGVSLTDEQAATVLECTGRMNARGGAAPFTGSQNFSLTASDGRLLGRITAEVSLPPGVVVVGKNLPAGSIIHAADLVLQPITSVNPGIQPFHSITDVVGLQTTWSIPAGTILSRTGVQRPQVVRRGDAVTLYARTAGIRVRTTVRAREPGGIGDLITVESLTDRAPFFARVTGVQEAEVYADPAGSTAPVPATAALQQVPASPQFGSAGGTVR